MPILFLGTFNFRTDPDNVPVGYDVFSLGWAMRRRFLIVGAAAVGVAAMSLAGAAIADRAVQRPAADLPAPSSASSEPNVTYGGGIGDPSGMSSDEHAPDRTREERMGDKLKATKK